MNWYTLFYWFSIIDNIKNGLGAGAILAGILLGLTLLISLVIGGEFVDENPFKLLKKVRKLSFIFFITCGILWMFIPTKKDMLLIVAGGTVGTFIQGDSSIQSLPADVTKYLHLSLKKEVEDLNSEARKELGLSTNKDKLIDKVKDYSKEELINYIKSDTTILK